MKICKVHDVELVEKSGKFGKFYSHWDAESMTLGLDWPITIDRPFKRLNKPDVIRRGAQLPLNLTFSCIRPMNGIHCGDCNKCAERQSGFRDAGVPDLTAYAVNRVN